MKLEHPRLVDEGTGQLWLRVQIEGRDCEMEISPAVARIWFDVMWKWFWRVVAM